MRKQISLQLLLLSLLFNFMPDSKGQIMGKPLNTGNISYISPEMEKLIPRSAKVEIIGSGFQHVEGPVWVKDSNMLLFSDTKAQTIYRWSEEKGLSKLLTNTGFTGKMPYSEEPGSNGLAVDKKGNLLICEHGDRRIAAYPLNGKYGKTTFADRANGKRFNSPNDIAIKSDGSVYFTDPPYGLPKKEKDNTRETSWCGVYRKAKSGSVELLTATVPFPNGLAFSPDEKLLYISNSEEANPQIMVFPVNAAGKLGTGKLFFDGKSLPKEQPQQVMDGLKTDQQGNIWACGPGGLLVISPTGKLLGKINTGEVIANCAWGNDGSVLYLTAGYFLYRIQTTAKGNF